jgi:hypothetical protein
MGGSSWLGRQAFAGDPTHALFRSQSHLLGIISRRCLANSEHGIARPRTAARTGAKFWQSRPQSQRRIDGLVAGGVGRRSDPASLPVPQTTLLLTLADDHTKDHRITPRDRRSPQTAPPADRLPPGCAEIACPQNQPARPDRRERRSRFGEREPGKGHGDDKRLSRDSEYPKRDRAALLELPHPCGSALRGTPICDDATRKQRLSATATNAVRSARSARRIAEFLSAPNETISDIHLGYWTTHKDSKVQMPCLGCHRRPIRS